MEHEKPIEGSITGSIPDWVCGSLYRNGPGLYEIGEHEFSHLFDPMAMFQRFHIENQRVTYQSRYLQSESYKANMAAQRIVVYGVGTLPVPDPCQNIFQRFLSSFKEGEKSDNTIVNFFPLKDELYSATESNLIHRIDPDTLETIEQVDMSQFVAVNSATAHPHFEHDGTVHNIGHSYKGGPKICLIKIPPKKDHSDQFPNGEVMSAIKSSGKMSVNYLHSFAMTENYYVYVEQPLFINLLKILTAKIRRATLLSAIEYWPTINARFRIIHRQTGEEVNPDFTYEAAPFMVFHHINAYEENGNIVMDVCGFKTDQALHYIYMKNLTSEQCEANWRKLEEPEPRRYVIPVDVSATTPLNENLIKSSSSVATAVRRDDTTIFCSWETLAETGFEFPQINYKHYNGKKYRYTYGVGWHNTGKHFHTICKIDTDTKTFVEWAEDKCYPSEPVFVPNPNATSEDDGVVLAAVNSSDFDAGKNAFLIVLDGRTLTEVARSEFNIQRFPKDFHGLFREKI